MMHRTPKICHTSRSLCYLYDFMEAQVFCLRKNIDSNRAIESKLGYFHAFMAWYLADVYEVHFAMLIHIIGFYRLTWPIFDEYFRVIYYCFVVVVFFWKSCIYSRLLQRRLGNKQSIQKWFLSTCCETPMIRYLFYTSFVWAEWKIPSILCAIFTLIAWSMPA